MSAPDRQLWQIISAREKSLAACERIYTAQLRESQQRRAELESEIARHRSLLADAGAQASRADADRRQELAAKEQALETLQAEAAAHRRWKQLCREAEDQLTDLKKSVAAEAAAKAAAAKLLKQTEQRVATTAAERDREIAAKEEALKQLRQEVDAHQRWEKLCREAEEQLAALKKSVEAEAAAKTAAAKLLKQTEQRVATTAAERDREIAAKEQALKQLRQEVDAHQRWEKLCREAEEQLAALKKSVEAEAAAKAAAAKLLKQTEQRVATTAAERDREIAAKEQALKQLRQEVDAHQRWEKLCREAEEQLAALKKSVEAEAAAKAAAAKLLKQTEQRVATTAAERDREIAAKEQALKQLRQEVDAHQRWEKLCREAEEQLAALKKSVEAEAAAKAAAAKLLKQTEQRVATTAAERDREIAAKEEALRLLRQEVDAHQRWEKLCREAEEQLAELKQRVVAETEARTTTAELLRQSEQRVATVEAERNQEIAAKEQAGLLLQRESEARTESDRLLRETEARLVVAERNRTDEITAREKAVQLLRAEEAAHQHWASLCQAAEEQLQAIRKQVEAEASEKTKAARLLAETEGRMRAAEADRDREAAAKVQALRQLQDELAAHQRWEKLGQDAEAQLAAVRGQLAGAVARQAAAAEQAAQARAESEATQNRLRDEFESARRALAAEMAVVEKELSSVSSAHQETRLALSAETAAHRQAIQLHQSAEARVAALAAELHAARAACEEERRGWQKKNDEQLAAAAAAQTRWNKLQAEAEASRARHALSVAESEQRLLDLTSTIAALQAESRLDRTVAADQAVRIGQLTTENAQVGADLDHLTLRLANSAFASDLAAEEHRLLASRHTLMGRWLAARNAGARVVRRLYCLLRDKAFVPTELATGPRIAQINTHDLIGGAERTSYDLHVQYRQRGLNPSLTVGGKHSQDPDVFAIPFKPYDWEPATHWRDRWGLTEVLYPTPVKGCFEWPHLRESHVVHIHNMHGHYWNSATLLALGMQHPVVLTLHDEYTMTGDCCYTYDCNRWQQSCGSCPQIGLDRVARYALGGRDLTRLNVQLKRSWFRAPRAYPMVIVTPSRWLAARARQSPNLRHLPVITIHNGVDLAFWCPQPQAEVRQRLQLPAGKTIGLVVANHLSDHRKGFDCVLQSIRALPAGHNLLFVVVGNITPELRSAIAGLPILAAGYVKEKAHMRDLFSAADFTFSMSRMDNLPYMCVESLACGRPVFGSQVGGIPEIINERELGWLTPLPFVHQAIAAQLLAIDQEPAAERQRRFAACRRSAVARFSLNSMVEHYLELYHEMLRAARAGRAVDLQRIAHPPNTP